MELHGGRKGHLSCACLPHVQADLSTCTSTRVRKQAVHSLPARAVSRDSDGASVSATVDDGGDATRDLSERLISSHCA